MSRNRSQPESSRVPIDQWRGGRSSGEAEQPLVQPGTDIVRAPNTSGRPLTRFSGVSSRYGAGPNAWGSMPTGSMAGREAAVVAMVGMGLQAIGGIESSTTPHSMPQPDASERSGVDAPQANQRREAGKTPEKRRRITRRMVAVVALAAVAAGVGVYNWRNQSGLFADNNGYIQAVLPEAGTGAGTVEQSGPGEVVTLTDFSFARASMTVRGEMAIDTAPDDGQENQEALSVDQADLALASVQVKDMQLTMDVPVGGETPAVTEAEGRYQVDLSRVSVGVIVPPDFIETAVDPPIYAGGADEAPVGAFGADTVLEAEAIRKLYNDNRLGMFQQLVGHGVSAIMRGEARPQVIAALKAQVIEAMGLDSTQVTFINEDKLPGNDPQQDYLAEGAATGATGRTVIIINSPDISQPVVTQVEVVGRS